MDVLLGPLRMLAAELGSEALGEEDYARAVECLAKVSELLMPPSEDLCKAYETCLSLLRHLKGNTKIQLE